VRCGRRKEEGDRKSLLLPRLNDERVQEKGRKEGKLTPMGKVSLLPTASVWHDSKGLKLCRDLY